MTSTTTDLPTPKKIVTYPIGDDPIAGAVFLFGDFDAPNLAICCAGYPDDHELLLPFASHLATKARCLVGVTCLPGYDDRPDHPYTANPNQGYSFEEMIDAMQQAVQVLRRESTNPQAKLTGIFHDWGVFPGTCYTNRALAFRGPEQTKLCPDQVVLFDVMGPPHPETPDMPVVRRAGVYETFVTLTYRVVFATAFGIRRFVSKALAQLYLIPNMITLNVFRIGPTLDIDAKTLGKRRHPISLDRMIYMAYPYFNMFLAMFRKNNSLTRNMHLPLDLVKTPVLYMYGVEKRVNFHDLRSVEILKRQAKQGHRSKAIAVEQAGHWLYIHQPELCLNEVARFVQDA